MFSKIILVFVLLSCFIKMNVEGNDSQKHSENEKLTLPEPEIPPPPMETNAATTTVSPSQVFEDNQNNPNYYPDGNIRFEVVGDSSHLFEEEDFQKVEVKPLRNEADLDHVIFDDIDLETRKQFENITESTIASNDTSVEQNKTNSKPEIKCSVRNQTNETLDYENKVRLVNGTVLSALLAESKPNECFVVMFYVPWCPFSTRLAPTYNALPRAFTQLENILAFDVSKSTGYNTKFGTNAVPMVIVFQQKNLVAKFNHTQKNLTDLIEFVSKNTGVEGNKSVVQLATDLEGPVPSVPVERFDYALLFSWIFLLFVASKILVQRLNIYFYLKRLFLKYFSTQHVD